MDVINYNGRGEKDLKKQVHNFICLLNIVFKFEIFLPL